MGNVNPPSNAPKKGDDYFGAGRFVEDLDSKGITALNLHLPFDEALKLHLALSECLLSLNRFNRSTKAGRAMGLCLSIKTNSTVAVIASKVPASQSQ